MVCSMHHWFCVVPLVEINCSIGVVMRQCFSILFEFQVIRKGCILLGPELPTGDGWERAIGVVLHHWRLFFSIRFEFQVIRKGCEGSGDDSWIWCGEFVWQWRKFKREMWRICFRKTLCGLKRNKGCWLNARRTKRMRLVGEVGWSIGECRFIFTMPVAGCRRIEFMPSATSC